MKDAGVDAADERQSSGHHGVHQIERHAGVRRGQVPDEVGRPGGRQAVGQRDHLHRRIGRATEGCPRHLPGRHDEQDHLLPLAARAPHGHPAVDEEDDGQWLSLDGEPFPAPELPKPGGLDQRAQGRVRSVWKRTRQPGAQVGGRRLASRRGRGSDDEGHLRYPLSAYEPGLAGADSPAAALNLADRSHARNGTCSYRTARAVVRFRGASPWCAAVVRRHRSVPLPARGPLPVNRRSDPASLPTDAGHPG